jgi:hypothetical protein
MSNPQNYGSFVPTTNVWDVDELMSVDVKSPEFKELLVRLYQNLNVIALVLNTKDSGYYVPSEFVNGQMLFQSPTATNNQMRQIFRLLVNFGALPNTAAKSVAHGLTPNSSWVFTRIYACATDPSGFNYIPIPYASPTLANSIELSVNSTNVTITTGSDRTNFTICYVIVEYAKF